jgi:hypothetical protein
MLTNEVVAADAVNLVTQAKDTLLESMALVESNCTPEEYAAYKGAVGRVVVEMLNEIVGPIYEHNPSLKPRGWVSIQTSGNSDRE